MKNKAIISGDVHLLKKPGLWAGRSEIAGDDEFGLIQVVDLAIEHDADLFLLGDTLDSVTNLPRPVTIAKNELSRAVKHGLGVYFIQGQHELIVSSAFESKPWLSLVDGTTYLHNCDVNFLGLRGFALDYFPQPFAALNLSKVPNGTEVLFLHGTLEEIMPLGAHFSEKLFPPDIKYVFAGDYHKHMLHKLSNGGEYYSVGSTFIGSVDEPVNKFVYLVEKHKTGIKVSSLPLRSRPILRYSEFEDGVPKIPDTSELPEDLKKPVILIDVPIEDSTVLHDLAKVGHLYMTSGSNPSVPDKIEVNQIENLSDRDILTNYLDPERHKDEFEFTLDVIESPTEDAINRLREKLGIDVEKLQASKEAEEETIIV